MILSPSASMIVSSSASTSTFSATKFSAVPLLWQRHRCRHPKRTPKRPLFIRCLYLTTTTTVHWTSTLCGHVSLKEHRPVFPPLLLFYHQHQQHLTAAVAEVVVNTLLKLSWSKQKELPLCVQRGSPAAAVILSFAFIWSFSSSQPSRTASTLTFVAALGSSNINKRRIIKKCRQSTE